MRKSNEKLNIAYKYSEKNFSDGEIFEILRGNDDLIKPIAVLNLRIIKSLEEGELLLSHLSGVDGKIREVVSFKILELYDNYPDFLNSPELYVDALCDVNPNVCRNVIELLKKHPTCPQVQSLIVGRIEKILEEIDKICSKFKRNREKSHAMNVKLFNLYWCLEGFYVTFEGKIDCAAENILLRSAESYDYTIREKVAKIVASAENPPQELLRKLQNDINFYVKRQLCGNIGSETNRRCIANRMSNRIYI